jgi:hypothetical protein
MKTFIIEIRWAFIFTVTAILWAGIEKLMGMHDSKIGSQPMFSILFAVPAIFVYVLALLEIKQKKFNGVMTWKEGVVHGFVMSLFVAVLSPVSQWATYMLISPEFFAKAVNFYTDKHIMTETRALEVFNIQAYLKKCVIESLSMGVITSVLVALIVKTKTPKP